MSLKSLVNFVLNEICKFDDAENKLESFIRTLRTEFNRRNKK